MVDARGLSCPEPVILTKKALKDKPSKLEVMVDNKAALENVTRYAKAVGYNVVSSDKGDGSYHLDISK